MARPEAEIDGSTPEGEFALGLRGLRDKARLDYRAMEKLVHFAASTLSKAASGNGLPTREVTLAYVRACGGDVQEWDARWRELRKVLSRVPRMEAGAVPSQRDPEGWRGVRPDRSLDHQTAGPDGAKEPEPELAAIPEQPTGDQILGDEPGASPDPEATDRIPRPSLSTATEEAPDGCRLLGPRRQGAHRAAQSSPRRGSTWSIFALVLLNISLLIALGWSTKGQKSAAQTLAAPTTVAASIQSFEIAEIDEPPMVLKAGARETRWVDLRNPNAADLVVTELIAQAKIAEDDSVAASRNCSADVLKISNLQSFPYRIDAKGTTRVGFRFEVSSRIPEWCEGRVVPVVYTGKAIQGTIIEGRPHVG